MALTTSHVTTKIVNECCPSHVLVSRNFNLPTCPFVSCAHLILLIQLDAAQRCARKRNITPPHLNAPNIEHINAIRIHTTHIQGHATRELSDEKMKSELNHAFLVSVAVCRFHFWRFGNGRSGGCKGLRLSITTFLLWASAER